MAINFKLHGIMLWAAWGLFSIFQVAVNRYSKGSLHGLYMWFHRFIGTLLMVLTFVFGFWAYRKMGWAILNNIHSYFVFPILFTVFFIAVGGVFTRSMMRRLKWKTKVALSIKRVHMTAAYTLVVLGCMGVAAGIYEYNNETTVPLMWLHLLFFVMAFIVLEVSHQMRLRREEPFSMPPSPAKVADKNGDRIISIEDFSKRVKQGEKLVILDDLVLDVSRFLDDHPGGKFSLENNIGRDVSKYFYGGYTQEPQAGMWTHTHSSIARDVVKNLIAGRLGEEAETRLMKIADVDREANLTGSVKTLKFADYQVQGEYRTLHEVSSSKCPLVNYSQIAKHYLVKSTSHPSTKGPSSPGTFELSKGGIRRHYTEAFSMRKEVWEALLALAGGSSDQQEALKQAITAGNSDSVALSIKNYSQHPGLSTFIHDDATQKTHLFEFKGPMGKGLGIQTEGQHVAFAAGTGALVFIDLVGHLILRILNECEGLDVQFSEPKLDLDKFEFVLYTSFASEAEAVGLPLIQALSTLCEKHGKTSLFSHHSRLSNSGSSEKWTTAFFTQKLNAHNSASAIWVCGPPLMQEECDRALYEKPELRNQVSVL